MRQRPLTSPRPVPSIKWLGGEGLSEWPTLTPHPPPPPRFVPSIKAYCSRSWAQIRLHPPFKAENDHSLAALVAGMTSNSFPRVEISLNSNQREKWRDCKKVTKSFTSNSAVSNQIDSAVCVKSISCPFNLKESKSLLYVITTSASSVSHCSLAKEFNKSSCMFK